MARKNYEQDLIKYICYDCMEEFIIGKTTADRTEQLRCPCCGKTDHLDAISWCEGVEREELELGCFGIGYEEDNEGKRVVNQFKVIEGALFMEKETLTEERKKELYNRFVREGKKFYTIEDWRWTRSKLWELVNEKDAEKLQENIDSQDRKSLFLLSEQEIGDNSGLAHPPKAASCWYIPDADK